MTVTQATRAAGQAVSRQTARTIDFVKRIEINPAAASTLNSGIPINLLRLRAATTEALVGNFDDAQRFVTSTLEESVLPAEAQPAVVRASLSRGEQLRARWGHLSAEQRQAMIAERSELSAERWVRRLEQRLDFENPATPGYPGLKPHFVDKHAPDIALRPNLAQRAIDGSHPRTGAPGSPQSSSQFIDWRTQMHALNEAMTRTARGLTPENYYMTGNRPAVLGNFGGRTVGRGFTRNSADKNNPHFHPHYEQYLVPLDRRTNLPYTAYPTTGM